MKPIMIVLVAVALGLASVGAAVAPEPERDTSLQGATEQGATPVGQIAQQECWTVSCNYQTPYGTMGTCSCRTCCMANMCNTTCSPPGCRCD